MQYNITDGHYRLTVGRRDRRPAFPYAVHVVDDNCGDSISHFWVRGLHAGAVLRVKHQTLTLLTITSMYHVTGCRSLKEFPSIYPCSHRTVPLPHLPNASRADRGAAFYNRYGRYACRKPDPLNQVLMGPVLFFTLMGGPLGVLLYTIIATVKSFLGGKSEAKTS